MSLYSCQYHSYNALPFLPFPSLLSSYYCLPLHCLPYLIICLPLLWFFFSFPYLLCPFSPSFPNHLLPYRIWDWLSTDINWAIVTENQVAREWKCLCKPVPIRHLTPLSLLVYPLLPHPTYIHFTVISCFALLLTTRLLHSCFSFSSFLPSSTLTCLSSPS